VWDRTWSISRWDVRGFSRASEDLGNTEPDGYANTTFSLKLGRGAGAGGRMDLSLRLTDATTDIDTFSSSPPFLPIDGSDRSRNKQAVTGLTIAAPLNARWDHRLVVGWSRDHLTTPGSTDLDAQSRQLDWQHTLGLGPDNLLTVGYEYQHRFAAISTAGEQKIITNAFYAQDQLAAFDPLFITVGGRTDDNNRFDRHNTYKTGASLNLARLRSRVFGNYGTGFRGPTLNDLYFPGFSNPNLRPEESSGYEAGVSIDVVPRALTLGATYFRTHYDDLIAVNSSFVPDNVKNAEARGVEVSGALRAPKASIEGSYTYTSTRDGSTNDQLLRRPRNKAALALIFEPERDANLRVDARYVGERLDFGSTLPSYLVVNVAASQRMGPHVEWFLRADNMFDRDYEEVTGYGTAGRSIYGGLTATF
jgi:vitamin B12 transporter